MTLAEIAPPTNRPKSVQFRENEDFSSRFDEDKPTLGGDLSELGLVLTSLEGELAAKKHS